jgi:hypothetical protein
VSENPSVPALALLGEIEVIEGVAGQPLQPTAGRNKLASTANSANILIAIGVHVRQLSG